MSEKRSVREIQKELARARREEMAKHKPTKSRNFSHIGPDSKEPKKERPGSADIPDYIGLPKKRKRTENKW
tara:strand:+ start:1748 stop:1960 length:213 start_codon:yes stop_codon:yes gene_type:complete